MRFFSHRPLTLMLVKQVSITKHKHNPRQKFIFHWELLRNVQTWNHAGAWMCKHVFAVTFSRAESQNGSRSRLLSLGGFARARLRAGGPGRPGAEDAIFRTRDDTRDREGERCFITQLLTHFITCTHTHTHITDF